MFPNFYFICMQCRLQVHKQACYLFQYQSKVVAGTTVPKLKIGVIKNNDKEIVLASANVILVAKVFQRHEHCYKNHTRVPSKSDYSTSNT